MKVDNNGGEFIDLPDGWMRCDGSVTPHGSIWEGKKVPNLNGERRFLRGGTDGNVLKLEEDQLQSHEHIFSDPGHSHGYEDTCDEKHGGDHHDGHTFHDEIVPKTTSKESTGISVTGVASPARHGDETRVKNMNIVWIIRVW